MRNKKYFSGFSLVELLVSMFVFVLIMLVVTSVFVTMVKTRKEAREMQKNMENIRYAIELMAKNIRTSTVDSPGSGETSGEIYIFNNSQQKCMAFSFDAENNKLLFKETFSDGRINMSDCSSSEVSYSTSWKELAVFSDFKPVESVKFYYTQFGSSDSTLGKVTISIRMRGVQESVQTSVSLVNYTNIR